MVGALFYVAIFQTSSHFLPPIVLVPFSAICKSQSNNLAFMA
jgi:hypothetical protein